MAAERRDMLQIGEFIKPMVSMFSAREIIQRLYGLEVTNIMELDSYDDRNFYVTVKDKHVNPHIKMLHPHGYVLKILNLLDSKNPTYAEAMDALTQHLGDRGITTPQPVPSVSGELAVVDDIAVAWKDCIGNSNDCNGMTKKHVVRLITFLPGTILLEVPHSPTVCYRVGKFAGKMDKELKTFSHEFYSKRVTIWSLQKNSNIKDFSYVLSCERDRCVVESVLTTFENEVMPLFDTFQKGVIHGDVNEGNILMALDKAGTGDYEVCGVIDFGDTTSSYFIFEVGVAMCHVMIKGDVVNPIEAAGHVLAGYLSEVELSQTELSSLKTVIAARLCQILVMGAYSHSLDPNNAFVLSYEKKGWPCLRELWSIPDNDLYTRWNQILSAYNLDNNRLLTQFRLMLS